MGEEDETPRGLSIMKIFPADWESAIAELQWDGEAIACVALSGVDLTARGNARTAPARTVVEFYGPLSDATPDTWTFAIGLDEVIEGLAEAEQWVRENEEGRTPVEGDGLTPEGAAFSTMSEAEQQRWLSALDEAERADEPGP